MKRRSLFNIVPPALALAGFVFAVLFTTLLSGKAQPVATPVSPPPASAFAHSVSGQGIVESNTRDIAIGSEMAGVVQDIHVKAGDTVEAGAPLFTLDERAARAALEVAARENDASQAARAEADVALADAQDQLRRGRGLERGSTISEDRLTRLRFAADQAQARLRAAEAQAASAKARQAQAQVHLDRLTVRAPVTGRVLRLNISKGEYLAPGGQREAPVLFGNDRPLHVRVRLDETDAWRLEPGAPAVALVRGNAALSVPLAHVRTEPALAAKDILTGAASEVVDTRVLEVLYRDARDPAKTDTPILRVGQMVDVFIETRE